MLAALPGTKGAAYPQLSVRIAPLGSFPDSAVAACSLGPDCAPAHRGDEGPARHSPPPRSLSIFTKEQADERSDPDPHRG